MKIAPVDRYGGWRPGGAGSESRTAAATRLQAVAPASAPDALAATLSAGRELPVVPVKQGADVQARTVQTSDRPKGVDPALNAFDEFRPVVVPVALTVEVFSASRPSSDVPSQGVGPPEGVKPAQNSRPPDATREAPVGTGVPADLPGNGVTSLSTAAKQAIFGDPQQKSEHAAEALRKQAAEAAKQPPKEPITKMLIDLVQNVWEASRFVVDAGTPQIKPGAPTLQGSVSTASAANAASVKAYVDTAAAGGPSSTN